LTYRELWRGAVWNFALGMLVSVVPALAFYYLAFDYTPAQLRRLSWLAIPGMASVDLCGLFFNELRCGDLGYFGVVRVWFGHKVGHKRRVRAASYAPVTGNADNQSVASQSCRAVANPQQRRPRQQKQ